MKTFRSTITLLLFIQTFFFSCTSDKKNLDEVKIYFRELTTGSHTIEHDGKKITYKTEILYLLPDNSGYQFIDTRAPVNVQEIIDAKLEFLTKNELSPFDIEIKKIEKVEIDKERFFIRLPSPTIGNLLYKAKFDNASKGLAIKQYVIEKKDTLNIYEPHTDSSTAYIFLGLILDNSSEAAKKILNASKAAALFNQGVLKNKAGDYQGAVECYVQSLEIQKNWSAYYNLGNAKMELNKLEEAVEAYSQSIELNPKNSDTYHNRGNAKGKQQDFYGAVEDFTKAIYYNPNNAASLFNRGSTKVYLKDKKAGCEDVYKAKELGYPGAAEYIAKWCDAN